MSDVPSRELRNDTRGVLNRVEHGENVTITVDGRPVATLRPIERRIRWIGRADFVAQIEAHQADAALTDELAHLVPDTTDDVDVP